MRRTQLYLDEPLWRALHARARREKTTISELVRLAVRERYTGGHAERQEAMQQFIGIAKSRPAKVSSVEQIRRLRKGSRLDRLAETGSC
ncbi:MAG: ribbon-helix-helix protein, CopG family [Bryobacterales bacterium]|nr:ribbon-helix-helix protein, CopG family [Bryobacterales bacterium]